VGPRAVRTPLPLQPFRPRPLPPCAIVESMVDLSTYRVIVRARTKPGAGYTYMITRLDDPTWSHGTAIYYSSPEAASEAGRVALESFLARRLEQS
jgi:hypothetical protein